MQEWGYQSWNHAPRSPIQLADVQRATPRIIERLDANFFRVRFDRLTPREKDYLRALAELGSAPQRSGDIAAVLGVKVPLFDTFMKRAMPQLPTKGSKA